ncbi:MAG: hypothetical protein FJX63_03375 [Alphaproteobacteria bacterium]|nr:hypothetical protein [Alphaproteobacteria bacterium]
MPQARPWRNPPLTEAWPASDKFPMSTKKDAAIARKARLAKALKANIARRKAKTAAAERKPKGK